MKAEVTDGIFSSIGKVLGIRRLKYVVCLSLYKSRVPTMHGRLKLDTRPFVQLSQVDTKMQLSSSGKV